MHNVVKWIIISTLVAGIIAIYKFLGKLFKEVTIRVFSYAWDSTGRILSRIKMRIFSKRKEPCSIDLTLDQIDAFGDKKSSDYAFIKGRMFEDYIANLYRTAGYNAKTTTELRDEGKLPPSIQQRGGSGEQGVDVLVEIPQKNGTVKLLAIQCKHYSNKVENSAVQEIATALAMYKADQGCVITNNLFTGPAKDLALANNVILVDRHGLAKMIEKVTKQYYESNVVEKKQDEKEKNNVLTYSNKKIKTDYKKNDEFWKKVS
jgi:restriction system protein